MARKRYIEIPDINIPRRVFVLGLAILIAAVAFGSFLYELVTPKAGWQQIEVNNPNSAAASLFVFTYPVGMGEHSVSAERRAVTEIYTRTLDETYQALDTEAAEGVRNLAWVNAHPNEDVQVEPALYHAVEILLASGSRYPYLAPLMSRYQALFACTYDEAAEFYDPLRSEESRRYAAELAALAGDPAAVGLRLLGGSTLRLEISPEYLEYARENEIRNFVDFGILRNAFLCDAVCEALRAQGYENGVISSVDGYSRNLSSEEFTLNLLDRAEGSVTSPGTVAYTAPAALAIFRGFPTGASDALSYYVYSDGTVAVPYLNAGGIAHARLPFLAALSTRGGAAELAIRTLEVYTGGQPMEALDDLSWVGVDGGEILLHGTRFRIIQQA